MRTLLAVVLALASVNPPSIFPSGTFAPTSNTAYCEFMGVASLSTLGTQPLYIRLVVTTASSPAANELGLFSTPLPPNRASQVLTKLVATGTLDSWGSPGVKGNSSPFSYTLDHGTNVWACMRLQSGSTVFIGAGYDFGDGAVLTVGSAGALTSATTMTGVVPALPSSATPGLAIAPMMRLYF